MNLLSHNLDINSINKLIMNGERGIDASTDFQRSYVVSTLTNEKTSLLQNQNTKEILFLDNPSIVEGHVNLHLHLLYPDRDSHTKRRGFAIKDNWAIESLDSRVWREGGCVGPHLKPIIFNPEIHSKYCNRILASTENLLGVNSDWDTTNYDEYPEWDKTKIKDVYNICNSLVEEFVRLKGKLEYVMVHPLYGSHSDIVVDGEPYISVEYKKDENDFIAVFPAISYNKANLINQIY